MQCNILSLGLVFSLAITTVFSSQANAQTFDFNDGTAFAGLETEDGSGDFLGSGIGTIMTSGGVQLSIVDVFANEFGVLPPNVLRSSEGDEVLAAIGGNSLGVDNPSVSDDDFFAGAGIERRDFNDGEGLVLEFDTAVVFTNLNFVSLDDGTMTVTIEGIGSFDFVDGTAGDSFDDPFGTGVMIPAGADITFSMSSPADTTANARIQELTVVSNFEDAVFNFSTLTDFDEDQGIGTTTTAISFDGNTTVTASIVDLFAPEFVGLAQTETILSASVGDMVTSDIGSDGLGVNNPSITDDDFFDGAGIETRDFNDGEGLVLSFDTAVSFTELDLDSVDDGTFTVTIPGIGSFDFVDEMLPGDVYVDPFGLALIPAGTNITFEFSTPDAPSGSIRIGGFSLTTEERMMDVLKGDVNTDGVVAFSDIPPFIVLLIDMDFQAEADTNCDMAVTFADIPTFIEFLIAAATQ